jgi:putative methyltransferase (TIGR04325 family)
MNLRQLLRRLTPPLLTDLYRHHRYGAHVGPIWDGVYQHYRDVPTSGPGYSGGPWLESTRVYTEWAIAEAKRQRMIPVGVTGYHSLMALLVAMLDQARRPVRVLDFGGGMGVGYAQLLSSLNDAIDIEYHVLDNPESCAIGTDLFRHDARIRFHHTLPEQLGRLDVLYMSGVIQFVEEYRGLIDRLINYHPAYVLYAYVPGGEIPTFATRQLNVRGSVIASWFIDSRELIDLMDRNQYSLLFKAASEREYDMSNFPIGYRLDRMGHLLFARRSDRTAGSTSEGESEL